MEIILIDKVGDLPVNEAIHSNVQSWAPRSVPASSCPPSPVSPTLRLLSTIDFSLVTEMIACCVRIVPLFLRFAAFEASFVLRSLHSCSSP